MFLDIGNTNVGFLSGSIYKNIPTEAFTTNIEKLLVTNSANCVVFASVVPSVSTLLHNTAQKLGIASYEARLLEIPLTINIQKKEELGIDRAINAYMAMQKYKCNAIVVDFGTALTFDVVHNNAYQGGMIFPGIASAVHNLHTTTAKLPSVELYKFKQGIGKNTAEAISFGTCIGYCGVLRETTQYIKNYYGCNFKIIFTGGSAKMFANVLPNIVLEQNLVIEFLHKHYKPQKI